MSPKLRNFIASGLLIVTIVRISVNYNQFTTTKIYSCFIFHFRAIEVLYTMPISVLANELICNIKYN